MTLVAVFISLLLLIGANALYVAAEFGAVSVRPSRVRELSEEGSAAARRLQPHIETPSALDRYIAACQIGITLSSLILGAYGESQLAPKLAQLMGEGGVATAAAHSLAAVIILLGLTVAQMVFGELVPKGIALQHSDRTALVTVMPMRWSLSIFRPLIWLFNGSGLAILRLIGLSHKGQRHVHNPGEIELLVSERAAKSELEPEERRRLRRALHLSSRSARELMAPRSKLVAIELEEPIGDVMHKLLEAPYSRFPVYRGDLDHPVGTLHAKDLAAAHLRGGATLSDLVRPHAAVAPSATADQILVLMRRRRLQQVLVVDAEHRVVGLVTMTDVLGEVFGTLAEELGAAQRRGAEARGR